MIMEFCYSEIRFKIWFRNSFCFSNLFKVIVALGWICETESWWRWNASRGMSLRQSREVPMRFQGRASPGRRQDTSECLHKAVLISDSKLEKHQEARDIVFWRVNSEARLQFRSWRFVWPKASHGDLTSCVTLGKSPFCASLPLFGR